MVDRRAWADCQRSPHGGAACPVEQGGHREGFITHNSLHAGREDAVGVLHTHTFAMSSRADGLLPLNQWSRFNGKLACHACHGLAFDLDERVLLAIRASGTPVVGVPHPLAGKGAAQSARLYDAIEESGVEAERGASKRMLDRSHAP